LIGLSGVIKNIINTVQYSSLNNNYLVSLQGQWLPVGFSTEAVSYANLWISANLELQGHHHLVAAGLSGNVGVIRFELTFLFDTWRASLVKARGVNFVSSILRGVVLESQALIALCLPVFNYLSCLKTAVLLDCRQQDLSIFSFHFAIERGEIFFSITGIRVVLVYF